MTTTVHDELHAGPGAPPPRRRLHRFTAPGWYRVLWTVPLAFLFGTGLVAGARAALFCRARLTINRPADPLARPGAGAQAGAANARPTCAIARSNPAAPVRLARVLISCGSRID